MLNRNSTTIIVVLLSLGIVKILLFYTAYTVHPAKIFLPDSATYINTAQALLTTGHFAISPDLPDVPQVMRTPGYPVFLAGSFWLFGERYAPLIILQILLSLGTLLIIYIVGKTLWDARTALIAVLCLAIDIPSFMSAQYVLTETLFTITLSGAMMTAVALLKNSPHGVFWSFLYGVLLSVATLIRPITYYLIVPMVIFCVLVFWMVSRISWKRIVLTVSVMILPWGILIGGWQVRNSLVTGKSEFSYTQDVNLYFYRGAGIIAQRDGIAFEEAQQRLGYQKLLALPPARLVATVAERSEQWRAESWRLILTYPELFLKDMGRGLLKMLLMPGEEMVLAFLGEYHETTGPIGDLFSLSGRAYVHKWVWDRPGHFALFVAAEGYLVVLYVCAAVSLWHLITSGGRDRSLVLHGMLWMMILYLLVVSAGPEAYSRFRIPIMPLLSLYAGHGFSRRILSKPE